MTVAWELLQTITPVAEWSFTPVISGSFFRLVHNIPSTAARYRGLIAQCYNFEAISVDDVSFYQIQKIYGKSERDILQLIDPLGLDNRQLAFRRLDKYSNSWSIDLEVFVAENDGSPVAPNREMIVVLEAGQTAFYLSRSPQNPTTTQLFINGVKATYDVDYSLEGSTLTWNSSLLLDPTDEVEILY